MALRKAGVDIFAQPDIGMSAFNTGDLSKSKTSRGPSRNYFPRLGTVSRIQEKKASRKENAASQRFVDYPVLYEEAESIQASFRQMLERRKLTKLERDELLARIERRLILSEAQLEATSLRYEKLEARGLDYAGKAAIAKQAVENGSLLEVSWPVSGGGLSRILGTPQALEKKDGDTILVIKPREDALHTQETSRIPGDAIRIPLRKISLLRRVKQSIFGE
jgi:hypothetical protein